MVSIVGTIMSAYGVDGVISKLGDAVSQFFQWILKNIGGLQLKLNLDFIRSFYFLLQTKIENNNKTKEIYKTWGCTTKYSYIRIGDIPIT